jgi:periplasmic copper chaperone A
MIARNRPRAGLALVIGLAAAAVVDVAAAAEPAIHVLDAWARATPPGAENGAVYLKIVNHGAADRLVGARTSAARATELHTSATRDGVVEMRRIDALPIDAGATVELAPGGTHVMLVGLASRLEAGAHVGLTLLFANAGEFVVDVAVVDARASPAAAHEHHAP